MTRAQLLVWMLIFGLIAGGGAVLSRVTLPEDVFAAAPVPAPATLPATAVAEALPAMIPVFPFPEELTAMAIVEQPVAAPSPEPSTALGELPASALQDVAAPNPNTTVAEAAPIPIAPLARQVTAAPVEAATLYVVADALNVRATPSADGPVVQKLAQGFAVTPLQRMDEWIGFELKDGSTGWLSTEYLSASKPEEAPMAADAAPADQPLNLM